MIYSEAVDYIHSLLKFGVRPGLTGMDALLSYLGNPHKGMKYIHVAGTNGKGSTSTAISNVLIDAGYNVGLYTSPYVSDFLERVQFNGKPIDREVFAHSVSLVKSAVESLEDKGIVITEFEALTASAFICFKSMNCDAVVLEVGLGGRLDATNIIDTPLVNVITSLSIDHSAILGNTIEEIAFEKCGTIKMGGRVVCSYGQPDGALSVVSRIAKERENSLVIPSVGDVIVEKSDLFGTDFIYKNKKYNVTMSGLHQVKNMICVIEVSQILSRYLNLSYDNVYNGISKTILPARIEILNKKPLVILDGGHNEDGAKAFYNAVNNEFLKHNKVVVVAGMMADKAVEDSLKPLMSSCSEFIAVTPENPRAMSCDELKNIAIKYCDNSISIDSPVDAVEKALCELEEDDMLCVVGSLYLAGEVRQSMIEIINSQNSN
jgi:dihydrofolate synthase/folylpolyglutamate synthase